MSKLLIIFFPLTFWLAMSCQNESKSAAEEQYDLYYDSIMVIHDRTMPLVTKLDSLRNQLKQARLVAINTDTNKYRKILNLLSELNRAEDAMFDWMNGFDPDTVLDIDKLDYIKGQLNDAQHMEGLILGGIGMTELYFEDYPLTGQ